MPKESEHIGETPDEAAIDWLVLMRSGAVGTETQRAFECWLQENAVHRQAYAEAEALWASAAQALKQSHPMTVPAGTSASAKTAVRRAWRPGLAAAASVLIGGIFVWTALVPRMLSDYSTGPGEQKHVVLADGSRVLLNTDSAISLDWSVDRRRIVLLKGEAEFNVAKDSRRPFVVAAGNVSVRALGTIFDVYKKTSDAIDVSVSEHTVAVDL